MRRDVAVPGQVVGAVDIAGGADTGLVEHADSGLCKDDRERLG